MQTKKIGIVIADDMEYAPIRSMKGEEFSFYKREGHKFVFSNEERKIELYTVCCGIGKTNSAAAAMYLIDNGCSVILNTGLSGGMSGVRRGDITFCDSYIEHDFDLTPLGYKKGEKPSQKYIYESDKLLLEFFRTLYPNARVGMAVTGDCFVCDDALRKQLIESYSPMSCDMESAAIASVCDMANVPFLAVRRVSDDAGDDAAGNYQAMNDNETFDLAVFTVGAVKEMLRLDELF